MIVQVSIPILWMMQSPRFDNENPSIFGVNQFWRNNSRMFADEITISMLVQSHVFAGEVTPSLGVKPLKNTPDPS